MKGRGVTEVEDATAASVLEQMSCGKIQKDHNSAACPATHLGMHIACVVPCSRELVCCARC